MVLTIGVALLQPFDYLFGCVSQQRAQQTPLHYASIYGYPETAKLLLDWGAEVDTLTLINESPLMYACKGKQNIDLIQLLLKHKANINLVNDEGETPLDICRNENASPKIINMVHPVYRQLM